MAKKTTKKHNQRPKLDYKNDYIFYAIIIAINLLVALLVDVLPKIIITHFDDYLDKGIVDGFHGSISLCVINAIVLFISMIVTAVHVNKRNNKTSLAIGIIVATLLIIFLPVYYEERSGGIAGINTQSNCSLFICYQNQE
ncbi:hypothetical protein J5500_04925 [Candidatus Saccharibacteria bacterium]|nr:hypothetical protein [Candidatus Saccharibacteria bacterium]